MHRVWIQSIFGCRESTITLGASKRDLSVLVQHPLYLYTTPPKNLVFWVSSNLCSADMQFHFERNWRKNWQRKEVLKNAPLKSSDQIQPEVQNLSSVAAKKPATFVTSLYPGMIVACSAFAEKWEWYAPILPSNMSDALTVLLEEKD